jgi:hypothetical protein
VGTLKRVTERGPGRESVGMLRRREEREEEEEEEEEEESSGHYSRSVVAVPSVPPFCTGRTTYHAGGHSTSSGHVGWLQESQAARQPTGPRKSTPARF